MSFTLKGKKSCCLAVVILSLIVLTSKSFHQVTEDKDRPGPTNLGLIQEERILLVNRTCRKFQHLQQLEAYKNHSAVYFTAESYNWSYCKIGKIASTFWTQFFYVLHHNDSQNQNLLNMPREDIHQTESREHQRWNKTDNVRMVVSARNPYTRLFSAYIDRIYLSSTSVSVRHDPKCKSQITFEEFLKYVISNTKLGLYDYHWSPIFFLCKPCEMMLGAVFKQETFKNDLIVILQKTNLEQSKRATLSQITHKSSNWSGYSLMKEYFEYLLPTNMRGTLDCQDAKDSTEKLWKTLQVQGLISSKVDIPKSLYKTDDDYRKADLFYKGVRMARRWYPLTREHSIQQRKKYLNEAYIKLDKDIIKGIQEVFAVDFAAIVTPIFKKGDKSLPSNYRPVSLLSS